MAKSSAFAGIARMSCFFLAAAGAWAVDILPSPSPLPPSTFPDSPPVDLVGGAEPQSWIKQLSPAQFRVTYQLAAGEWSGASIRYDDFGTPAVEWKDLACFSSFVFGVRGDASKVKVEFCDANGQQAAVHLVQISDSATKYYEIPALTLTNAGLTLARVTLIHFVVDVGLAGSGAGAFTVDAAGLFYQRTVEGEAAGTVSAIPDQPGIAATSGGAAGTLASTLSSSEFKVAYAISSTTFAGGTILFDDFGTPAIETADLSALATITFRVAGTAKNIRVEFEDSQGQRVNFIFRGTNNPSLSYFPIPSSEITLGGVDMTRIRFINFIVDANLATNTAGQFTVTTAGILDFNLQVSPSPEPLPVSTLPNLPRIDLVGGAESQSVAKQINPGRTRLTYDLSTGEWTGLTIRYDDFGTPAIESQDLSSLASLEVDLRGEPDNVRVEFHDASGNKVVATLIHISSSQTQSYSIPMAPIAGEGLNLCQVAFISFVVDPNLAGPAGLSGALDLDVDGLYYQRTVDGTASGALSAVPNKPKIIATGGSAPGTLASTLSSSAFQVTYDITATTFAGGSILFDDYGTTPIETADLSGLPAIVFHITGTPRNIKVEFEDDMSRKVDLILRNVDNPSLSYFAIPLSEVASGGVDIARIRSINFVVDQNLAQNASGQFTVSLAGGLDFNLQVVPSPDPMPVSTLPGLPLIDLVGGAESQSVATQVSPGRTQLTYDLAAGEWSGLTVRYDDFGTPAVESQDLSLLASFVFGVQGGPDNVKVEFSDASGTRIITTLTAVSSAQMQYYSIPAATLAGEGLDLSQMTFISLVIDANLAGPADLAGILVLDLNGLFYQRTVDGMASGLLSSLPDMPKIIVTGGSVPGTIASTLSLADFKVNYNISNVTFAGGTILFDDFGTPGIEASDLSGLSAIVFRVAGSPRNVKMEIEDDEARKVNFILRNVDDASRPYFHVPSAEITSAGVDLAKVRFINFVVDQNLAQNASGDFTVATAGTLDFNLVVAPSSTPPPLTVLPGEPQMLLVGGAEVDSSFKQITSSNAKLAYDLAAGEWTGLTILYDNYGTPAIESWDFSLLPSLVFALQGSAQSVKMEFSDASGKKVIATLVDVSPGQTKHYFIETSFLSAAGLDLEHVTAISMVIDANLAGPGGLAGSVDYYIDGVRLPLVIQAFGADPGTMVMGNGAPSQLDWEVTGATSVSIDQGVGTDLPAVGTASVIPTDTTTYTLTATGPAGTKKRTVTVYKSRQLAGLPVAYEGQLNRYAEGTVRYFTSPLANNTAVGFTHAFFGTGTMGQWREVTPSGQVSFPPWSLERGYGAHVNINEVTLRFMSLAAAYKMNWLGFIPPENRYAESWGQILKGLQTLRLMQTSGNPMQYSGGSFHRTYLTTTERDGVFNLDRFAHEIVRDPHEDQQSSDDNSLPYMNLLIVEGFAQDPGVSIPDKDQIIQLCRDIRQAINLQRFYQNHRIIFNWTDGQPNPVGYWDRMGAEGPVILSAGLLSGQIDIHEFYATAASLVDTQRLWPLPALGGSVLIGQGSYHGAMFIHGLRSVHGLPVTAAEAPYASYFNDSLHGLFRAQLDLAVAHNFKALGTQVMTQSLGGYPLFAYWSGPVEYQGEIRQTQYAGNEEGKVPNVGSYVGDRAHGRLTGPHAWFVPLSRWQQLAAAEVATIFEWMQVYEAKFFHEGDDASLGWEAIVPWHPDDVSQAWIGGSRLNYSDWGRPYEALNAAYSVLHIFDALNPQMPLAGYSVEAPRLQELAAFYDNGVALPDPTTGDIIMDNDAAGVTLTGSWTTATTPAGYHGGNYLHDDNAGKGAKSVRFTPNLPSAGTYQVFVRWPAAPHHAAQVPIDVASAGAPATVLVNQQAIGGAWVSLGTYAFNAGTGGSVLIRTDGTTQYVAADAVRFLKLY